MLSFSGRACFSSPSAGMFLLFRSVGAFFVGAVGLCVLCSVVRYLAFVCLWFVLVSFFGVANGLNLGAGFTRRSLPPCCCVCARRTQHFFSVPPSSSSTEILECLSGPESRGWVWNEAHLSFLRRVFGYITSPLL